MRFLRNYALKLTKDPALVDDLVQETYVRLFSSDAIIKPGTNVKGYLGTIMKNCFVDQVRSLHGRQVFIEYHSIDYYYGSKYPVNTDSKIIVDDIWRAVQKLPASPRRLIAYRVLGYKYYEIAEELGITIGYVKSGLFHAREKLQRILDEENYEPRRRRG